MPHDFRRCKRSHTEGMNARLKLVCKYRVYETLTLHPAQSCEAVGDNPHAEMCFAPRPRTRMSGVTRTFIVNFEQLGVQRSSKFLLQCLCDGHCLVGTPHMAISQAIHFLVF